MQDEKRLKTMGYEEIEAKKIYILHTNKVEFLTI
jgi:hypothetical protein